MADLKVDDEALHGAADLIGGVARDFESLAGIAERNLGQVRDAISHLGLVEVLDEVLRRSQQAHRTVHGGLTRLRAFASDSAQTFTESDLVLASRVRES